MLNNSWIKRFWNKVFTDVRAFPCVLKHPENASWLCLFPTLSQHRELRKGASQNLNQWLLNTHPHVLPKPTAEGADSSSQTIAAFSHANTSFLWAVNARSGQMDSVTVRSVQGQLLCFLQASWEKDESARNVVFPRAASNICLKYIQIFFKLHNCVTCLTKWAFL